MDNSFVLKDFTLRAFTSCFAGTFVVGFDLSSFIAVGQERDYFLVGFLTDMELVV